MSTPLRDEDVELRRLLIKSIGDGFTIYVSSTTKAYQEGDDRRTAPGFIADAVLEALADRLLPPVVSERVEWQSRRSDEPWVSCDFPHPDGCTWPQHRFRRVVSYTDGSERIYRWKEK